MSYTVTGRRDVQPIRRDLAELLCPWLAARKRDERPLARLPGSTGQMLCKDLAAARRQWVGE